MPRLSPAEQIVTGSKYLKEIDGLLLEILELAKQAKRTRDVVKHNCLSQYAKMITAVGKRAEENHIQLSLEIQRLKRATKPVTEVNKLGLFPKIFAARERAERLASEARACIGEVIVQVPPTASIPDEEPPGPGFRPMLPFKPPVASPARAED